MSTQYELTAEVREGKGTGASRRLRRTSKIPGIIYGGGKDPAMVAFDHDTVYHLLEHEAFHTSILNIKTGNTAEQAILRDVQMHPFRQIVLHMDLQRISASEKIHMRVPLHFVGEDIAPGVKQQGGMVSHLMTEVDITCLPKDLPEYLAVDLSNLHIGDSVHMSDIPLPDGVEITTLAHGGDDQGVATVMALRTGADEAEEAPAEAAPAAGEAEKKEGE
ncbi:MAG: 50S ribosomal protein L25/general stress protein Ctc [Gammaproteobacteria bacterium]|nr:50S ribosomal protein L25/general stress protein Ctc [Gammaproteobacteria bacterium]